MTFIRGMQRDKRAYSVFWCCPELSALSYGCGGYAHMNGQKVAEFIKEDLVASAIAHRVLIALRKK